MIAQVEGVWCGQIFRERGREREICWVLSARVCDGKRLLDGSGRVNGGYSC